MASHWQPHWDADTGLVSRRSSVGRARACRRAAPLRPARAATTQKLLSPLEFRRMTDSQIAQAEGARAEGNERFKQGDDEQGTSKYMLQGGLRSSAHTDLA